MRALTTSQKLDGHWENGDYESGTWVYTTTMSALMLEVYYRYPPACGPAGRVPGVGHDGAPVEVN